MLESAEAACHRLARRVPYHLSNETIVHRGIQLVLDAVSRGLHLFVKQAGVKSVYHPALILVRLP